MSERKTNSNQRDNNHLKARSNNHHIDLYAVLGVTSEATNNDIEKKYDELCQLYHPDNVRRRHREHVKIISDKYKLKGKSIPQATLEQLNEKLNDKLKETVKTFNLVNQAYSKLSKDRATYDAEYKQFQDLEFDFVRNKESAVEFMKSQKTVASSDDIANRKKLWNEMNRKHGFNENETKREVSAMTEGEMTQKMDEFKKLNKQYDEEDKPDLILDPKNVDMKRFHALFEKKYKRNDNKGELMETMGPRPSGLGDLDQYCGLNQFDQAYAEDDTNLDDLSFSAADFTGGKSSKLTKKDIDELTEEDYVSRNDTKLTQKDIDAYEQNREIFTKEREEWTMKNYSTDIMYGAFEGLDQSSEKVFGALEFGDKDTQDHYRNFLAQRNVRDNLAKSKSINKSTNTQNNFQHIFPQNPRDQEKFQHSFPQSSRDQYYEQKTMNPVNPMTTMMGNMNIERPENSRSKSSTNSHSSFNSSLDDLIKRRAEENMKLNNNFYRHS